MPSPLTTAAALATSTVVSAYLNARLHISKDLEHLYYQHRGAQHQARLKAENKINVWRTFTENSLSFADEECIWFSDPLFDPPREVRYTWREAYERACRWAAWFLANGVGSKDGGEGECVGLYLQNSPDFVLAWMGLLAIGCWPAMINYNLVGAALAHCVKVAGCKLLLVDEDFAGRVFEHEELQAMRTRVVALDSALKSSVDALAPSPPGLRYTANANEKTKLALRYTSGTTGKPKGVMATTGRYYARLASQFTQMGIRPLRASPYPKTKGRKNGKGKGEADRWYICMPMNHSTAGSAALICMLFPVPLCIGKRFSASRFWDEVRASGATVGTYVGEIARYLLALPPSPLDKQHKMWMLYGNGLRPDVWERFQERFGVDRICEFYGSTEGGLSHIVIQDGEFLRGIVGHDGWVRRMMLRDKVVPVEVDAQTNEIVRDPVTGFARRMPYEVGGELLFRLSSPAEFVGYYQNPEATEKKLARSVFAIGDHFYRSGDSLKRCPDGKWTFLDRLGDTFRWKGENVSTAEVGECLGKVEGVVDANVYGVEVPGHEGRAGCAALLLSEPASALNLDMLLRHARKDLPPYAVPLFLRIVRQAALNSSGLKQDKLQPRLEGVDPGKVGGDHLFVLRGDEYVLFTHRDWHDLVGGRARL